MLLLLSYSIIKGWCVVETSWRADGGSARMFLLLFSFKTLTRLFLRNISLLLIPPSSTFSLSPAISIFSQHCSATWTPCTLCMLCMLCFYFLILHSEPDTLGQSAGRITRDSPDVPDGQPGPADITHTDINRFIHKYNTNTILWLPRMAAVGGANAPVRFHYTIAEEEGATTCCTLKNNS